MDGGTSEVADGPGRPRRPPSHQLDLLRLLFLLWWAVNQLFRAWRHVGQQDVDLSDHHEDKRSHGPFICKCQSFTSPLSTGRNPRVGGRELASSLVLNKKILPNPTFNHLFRPSENKIPCDSKKRK